jgi:hypothetical protein
MNSLKTNETLHVVFNRFYYDLYVKRGPRVVVPKAADFGLMWPAATQRWENHSHRLIVTSPSYHRSPFSLLVPEWMTGIATFSCGQLEPTKSDPVWLGQTSD